MIPDFSAIAATLAQAQTSPSNPIDPEAYRQVSALTLMLALLGVVLITVLALIVVIRRSQRRKAEQPKPGPTKHVDAWAESGKRFDSSIVEINPEDDDFDE